MRPGPEPGDLLGTAAYGTRFACAAERDNVFGVQFHPEKSSAAGLRLLSNFAGICASVPGVILYPAIDIRGGQAVRLLQGDYERETTYDADPVDAAKRWADEGAEFLHVVDLDGAKAGEPQNLDVGAADRGRGRLPDPGRRRPARRRRRSRRCSTPARSAS